VWRNGSHCDDWRDSAGGLFRWQGLLPRIVGNPGFDPEVTSNSVVSFSVFGRFANVDWNAQVLIQGQVSIR